MSAHELRTLGADEKRVGKARKEMQLCAEADEAIDGWHEVVLAPRVLEPVESDMPLDMARSLFMLRQAFLKNGCHVTADASLKACLDPSKAENAEPLFLLNATCIYGGNMASIDGRGRDALLTLKAAADGLATIRGARDCEIYCNVSLTLCYYYMRFCIEALGTVTKALKSIYEFGDAAWCRSWER